MDRRMHIGAIALCLLTTLGVFGCRGAVSGPAGANGRTSITPLMEKGRPLVIMAEGKDVEAILDAALKEVGGLQRFIRKGDSVLIKPNATWARTPDQAATTNPELLAALIRRCLAAGASRVTVGEHSINSAALCMERTGIGKAVEEAGGRMVFWSKRDQYRSIEIPDGTVMKTALVSSDVLDADVLINMPKAKHHSGTRLTLALKNFMGVAWEMSGFHRLGLEAAIVDINRAVKADLIITDAITILTTNGPGGPGIVKETGTVIIGTDPVAVDACTTPLFDRKAEDIGHIRAAAAAGLGTMDPSGITLRKVTAGR